LYVGQKWNPEDNFVSATDEEGKEIPWEDSRITKNGASIDTSKPGVNKIKYTYKGKVKDVDSEFTVTVKEDKSSLKTKDSMLYVGQKWNPEDNFVSATDEEGKEIPWEDSRITKNGASIDTSKADVHKIKYTYKGKVKDVDSEFTVTVKEDKTTLELQDVHLYVGQTFDSNAPFKRVIDKDGHQIKAEAVNWYYIDETKTKTLDTTKPGTHTVRIVYPNALGEWKYSATNKIIIKEDKSSLKTKDSMLYVGQKWNPEDNFVSATDEEGKEIPWEDSRITKNGASIDTSKPGVNKIKYTYKGKVKDVDSELTVTVQEDKTTLNISNLVHGESGRGFHFENNKLTLQKNDENREFVLTSSDVTNRYISIEKNADMTVILDGLSITSECPIVVENGARVHFVLHENSNNTLIATSGVGIYGDENSTIIIDGNEKSKNVGNLIVEAAPENQAIGGVKSTIYINENADLVAITHNVPSILSNSKENLGNSYLISFELTGEESHPNPDRVINVFHEIWHQPETPPKREYVRYLHAPQLQNRSISITYTTGDKQESVGMCISKGRTGDIYDYENRTYDFIPTKKFYPIKTDLAH
ncbi:bacterial Ig-like domain-containing protein, partial [Enterococcus faecalis]|uniref:bacterial Ig-like domain-containing protein n=1 Tax=Enterococcus faecalis TaxID=1351 RepID=UPI0015C41EC2